MSLRKLPAMSGLPPLPDGVTFDVHPEALAAWSPTMASSDDAVISIFDQIGEDWNGNGVTARRISAALRSIGDKPVTVQINSPGGNFFEGLAIYNLLREHPDIVTVQVIGVAASAASVIAMAGDQIQISKSAVMMIHNTQWVAIGDRHAMAKTASQMAMFDQLAAELYTDRTGLAVKDVAKMMDDTTFMSGTEAERKGFATALLGDEARAAVKNDTPLLYRLEAALAKGEAMPRAERRKLLREITEGTPRAAPEAVMPGADGSEAGDGSASLRLALNSLKLATL